MPAEELHNPRVVYRAAPAVNAEEVAELGRRMHRLTVNEMREELRKLHLDCRQGIHHQDEMFRGNRSTVQRRLRDYHRRQALIAARADPGTAKRNKTERFFDYLLVDEFHCFVRPEINPRLTDFCSRLTGIGQDQVDAAQPFPAVLEFLRRWMGERRFDNEHRVAFVTDGPWDLAKFFQMQCFQSGFQRVPHDFRYWINIRKSFAHKYGGTAQVKFNLDGMLKQLGMEFIGRPHSGIDDARNIARILLRLIDDGAPLRINERLVRRNEAVSATTAASGRKTEDEQRHLWKQQLPYKMVSVSKEEFLTDSFLDCDSCDESVS